MKPPPHQSGPEARQDVSPLWSRAYAKAEGWVSMRKRMSPGGATQFLSEVWSEARNPFHRFLSYVRGGPIFQL